MEEELIQLTTRLVTLKENVNDYFGHVTEFLKIEFVNEFADTYFKNKEDATQGLWQLEVSDILLLKIWTHTDKSGVKHLMVVLPSSEMIYDPYGKEIAKWGSKGHCTEGVEFPKEINKLSIKVSEIPI